MHESKQRKWNGTTGLVVAEVTADVIQHGAKAVVVEGGKPVRMGEEYFHVCLIKKQMHATSETRAHTTKPIATRSELMDDTRYDRRENKIVGQHQSAITPHSATFFSTCVGTCRVPVNSLLFAMKVQSSVKPARAEGSVPVN